MAKTKTKKTSQRHRIPVYRRPWFIVLILLAILAGVAYCALNNHKTDESGTDTDNTSVAPTSSANAVDPTTPAGETVIPDTPDNEDEPEKTIQYEGEDPNTMESLTGSIARSSISGSTLTIVALVDQYLSNPGICVITLQNSAGNEVYKASSDAVADVTTSICEDFIIPITEFPSGNYQIEITISGDGKEGKINGEVSLWAWKLQLTIYENIAG